MLSDFTGAERIYIACGYTDLRRGIDGLAGLVQQQFRLDPFTKTLFRNRQSYRRRHAEKAGCAALTVTAHL